MDENTKLEVLEFLLALLDLLRRLILRHRRHAHEQRQNRKDSLLHRVDCFESFYLRIVFSIVISGGKVTIIIPNGQNSHGISSRFGQKAVFLQ